MKNPTTLLVVEDREGHLADFKAMLESVRGKLPFQLDVLYAADLGQALLLLPQADLVMTDVFFPAAPGDPEKPHGKTVVARCLEQQKPVVWVSSTFHHGSETNDVNEWGRERGLEMFDCYVKEGQTEAPHKPWDKALYGVIALAIGIEDGIYAIENDVILGDYEHPNEVRGRLGSDLRDTLRSFFMNDDPVALKMSEMGIGRP